MKIAMFEGYRKHPRKRRSYRGGSAHRKSKRRSYRGAASPKQLAVRRKFKLAAAHCKAVKGKAKYKCMSAFFKRK